VRRTHIVAGEQAVEVNSPLDDGIHHRAARYVTLAYAARRAAGGTVSNVPAWVEATHSRACAADAATLDIQMKKWATATRDRFELLGPVCDLLLGRARRVGGRLVDCSDDIPAEIEDAAVTLFGHAVFSCSEPCRVCRAAREGDWTRALRFSAGDEADFAAAALADGYRAARRGGFIPPVLPDDSAHGDYSWTPAGARRTIVGRSPVGASEDDQEIF
jgi:hypothetical protein